MICDNLISRLEGVKQRGPAKWIARCPAHDDRTASLSISEGRNGGTVINCFAGCEPEYILAAVGMEFSDIMPERLEFQPSQRVRHWSAADLLNIVHTEVNVLAILASDLARGVKLTDTDQRRLDVCAMRLNYAATQLNR